MQKRIKETEGKRLFRRKRSNKKEYDALNEANAYLLGVSQLNAELDARSHRATHNESELLTETLVDQNKANMQKLDDALAFLCKIADIDIKEQQIFVAKSPSENMVEALICLCKIADIDIKEDMAVQKSVDTVDLQVETADAVNDDDTYRDEDVKERATLSKPLKQKKTTKGKLRNFFRRLVGKN